MVGIFKKLVSKLLTAVGDADYRYSNLYHTTFDISNIIFIIVTQTLRPKNNGAGFLLKPINVAISITLSCIDFHKLSQLACILYQGGDFIKYIVDFEN